MFYATFNLHLRAKEISNVFQIRFEATICEEKKMTIIAERDLHHCIAETARNELKSEAKRAKTDSLLYVCSFDPKKVISFPTHSVSIAYYKHNMYCNNFSINEISKDRSMFYVWKETEEKLGSQEIAAYLSKHFRTLSETVKYVVLFSDICIDQNRNFKLALSMLKLVSSENAIIDHKFFMSGHYRPIYVAED